jgi:hypothetical protein
MAHSESPYDMLRRATAAEAQYPVQAVKLYQQAAGLLAASEPVTAAQALHRAAGLFVGAESLAEARLLLQRAAQLLAPTERYDGQAIVWHDLGVLEAEAGNFAAARANFEAALKAVGLTDDVAMQAQIQEALDRVVTLQAAPQARHAAQQEAQQARDGAEQELLDTLADIKRILGNVRFHRGGPS